MKIKKIFRFKGVDGLHCEADGRFYFNDKPTRKIYNNGSISILAGKSKISLKKLRTLAYKSQIIQQQLPF